MGSLKAGRNCLRLLGNWFFESLVALVTEEPLNSRWKLWSEWLIELQAGGGFYSIKWGLLDKLGNSILTMQGRDCMHPWVYTTDQKEIWCGFNPAPPLFSVFLQGAGGYGELFCSSYGVLSRMPVWVLLCHWRQQRQSKASGSPVYVLEHDFSWATITLTQVLSILFYTRASSLLSFYFSYFYMEYHL